MNKEQLFLNELADLMEKHKCQLNIERYKNSLKLCIQLEDGFDTIAFFNNDYGDYVYIDPENIREAANA